jgi:intein/homing endonuclease
MNKLNPCVTGDTKVWTVEGLKTFKELADANDDVNVYCLDGDGNIKVSKMFHPRVSGYNVELVKITLTDGTVLKATVNHMFLTDDGYVMAGDLFDGYKIVTINKNIVTIPSDIDENDKQFTEYTGTKKGTVIKKCEVSGEEFECIWDEREICTREGYEADLYNIKLHKVCTSSNNYEYVTVEDVELLDKREDVYNGTVAVYHNYFTVDENTNTIVNQLNCGE